MARLHAMCEGDKGERPQPTPPTRNLVMNVVSETDELIKWDYGRSWKEGVVREGFPERVTLRMNQPQGEPLKSSLGKLSKGRKPDPAWNVEEQKG